MFIIVGGSGEFVFYFKYFLILVVGWYIFSFFRKRKKVKGWFVFCLFEYMFIYFFEKLEVWNDVKEIVKIIYIIINKFFIDERFGLIL